MISKNAQAYVLQRTENLQEQIELKAGKDDIISTINLSSEGVAIQGDKIDLTGAVSVNDNVYIDEEGKITAVDGTFSGTIMSNNATITGGAVKIETSDGGEDLIKLAYTDDDNAESYTSMSPYKFQSKREYYSGGVLSTIANWGMGGLTIYGEMYDPVNNILKGMITISADGSVEIYRVANGSQTVVTGGYIALYPEGSNVASIEMDGASGSINCTTLNGGNICDLKYTVVSTI